MPSSTSRQTGPRRNRPGTRIPIFCVVDPRVDDYQEWNALALENGVQLQVVATADEALRLSRTQAVSLWVVNTHLPGLSGCELCGMLKTQFPTIPVYLVAEEHSIELERAAWAARASMFGCKPTHAQWLANWLRLRTNREVVSRHEPSANSL